MNPEHPCTAAEGHLKLRRLGIDTHQELVVYMRADCAVCRSEGFTAQSRVQIAAGGRTVLATLNVVHGDWLSHGDAGLSESAWRLLGAQEGQHASFSHPRPVDSLSAVRGKVFGHALSDESMTEIVRDIVAGRYADVDLAAFITACADDHLSSAETISLTRAMVAVGRRLSWPRTLVVDKHCVGGLPGNRTTPVVVAIAAANGLCMPKTSSRAITSPAGTADAMETLAPVDLSLEQMRAVVEKEGGCIVWGGSVDLSPADEILIRVERALDIDSEGQLVASVLSKKVAAGSTHVVLDIPVGPTAKVRSEQAAAKLTALFQEVARATGLAVRAELTDGTQPVGRGIGPALEARDVLAVLRQEANAPKDLRDRSLRLAGAVLEIAAVSRDGEGLAAATRTLESGEAWRKFAAICQAQGGMREPALAPHRQPLIARRKGLLSAADNRRLARIAKLAGAPRAPSAGVQLHVRVGDTVDIGQPLLTVHAESTGELAYAMDYVGRNNVFTIVEERV
ncbi:MAG: thymidine phosphorylase family protein [Planctomycetes bacterium]|nr:thymidine phosphorylase family protein [Planctomycetota bacterium]